MTRTTLAGSVMVLVLLTAGVGEVCRGDPPPVTDLGGIGESGPPQTSQLGSDPLGRPRVEQYSNSGCLEDPNDPWWLQCEDEDEIELTVDGDTLYVLHRNATYNCCPDEIVISVSLEGDLIKLTEEEILTNPCYCICCYDVEATIVDIPAGAYLVEFCWFDYETYEVQCYTEEIVIPGGGGGPPRPDPPPVVKPEDPVAEHSEAPELGFGPLRRPRIEQYSTSGCLDDPNDPWWPPCGEDEIELTVEGYTLYVQHRNAMYNCCPDEIVISVSLEGDLIKLTEEEILTNPCYCVCCYDTEATVVDIPAGAYLVEFCWFDYETYEVRCYTEEIVIPQ